MSKIEELIEKLCPNGVEYKTLGELGKFYGGITGKSKEDFKDGNAKFITYKNVYENISLKLDVEDRVKISEKENQRTLEYGDIIFTGSSETPDECGLSSVVTEKVKEKLYLNSFCFFFRMDNKDILNPNFAKHLFRSSNLRYQIGKTASGVTRFNVSKKAMEKICIPVPPLEVQCEIVHILDDFTLLSAELSAELKARQKQYEYYKGKLLTFSTKNNNIQWTTLGTYCKRLKGTAITASKMKEIADDNGNIRIFAGGKTMINTNKSNIPDKDIIKVPNIIVQSRGIIDFIYYDKPCSFKREMWSYTVENIITLKFIYYYLKKNIEYFRQRGSQMGSMPQISLNITEKYKIPLLTIDEQERIVNILDRFDKLCNDISEGLPAEIEARQKQYEYYRDKLLTFKELKVNE